MNTILKEAKRLYLLSWAIHWIKPKSKAPVKAGWSGPNRDDWKTLVSEYREGYGLGVRMGEASKVAGGYLANIDVDIKSSDPRHKKEALAFVRERFPDVVGKAPCVKTGYGFRFFVVTREPAQSGKLGSSGEETKVLLPTAPMNRRQQNAVAEGRLTAEELAKGWRIRPAWEVEFMSEGRQVVLPPSIHPETEKPYRWLRGVEAGIPLIGAPVLGGGAPKGTASGEALKDFKPVAVDLSRLSERVRGMLEGEGVEDRSAALMSVAMVMHRARYSEAEILTTLTDRGTFLGEVAYEKGHADTKSRARAAQWVKRYTLDKARQKLELRRVFEHQVEVSPMRGDDAGAAEPEDERDWQDRLSRIGKNGEGPPKPTLENTLLVLDNAVSRELFKRDEFSLREFYGVEPPWQGAKGEALTDDDAIAIKVWLAENYRFEPSVHTVHEAMVQIARRNRFHPIRDELMALPPWDGRERIDGWLAEHFNAEGPEEYLAQVFRKWLVASITRVFNPGAKFDWMPIFEGNQGTGKSSFGAILFGESYFSDWLPPLSDKDAALGLQGIRCHEFGELESLRRNELETVKGFVTRLTDKVRPPYGRRTIEMPRQVVFFGTTNKERYFRDDSGNRRFNPIEVGKLDFKALRRDREQLWAEAMFIYQNKLEPILYLEGEANEHAKTAQEEKMVDDESAFMVDAIERFLAGPDKDKFDFEKFKLVDLFRGDGGPLGKCKETGFSLQMAAKAIKKLGAEGRHIKGFRWWRIPRK